jgi:murein DD-endopeptidase MepM/ murein hydrolase activator NlpD
MPEGVPIVAALDGTVRLARGDSVVGGCDPRYARFANYVVITHANGLETQYLHFSQVLVHEGDVVKKGTLLGYSGSTGWACGSHLHFKVAQPLTPGWNNPSVPARLVGYGDPERGMLINSPACVPADAPVLASNPSENAPLAGTPANGPATGSSSSPVSSAPLAPAQSAPTQETPSAPAKGTSVGAPAS